MQCSAAPCYLGDLARREGFADSAGLGKDQEKPSEMFCSTGHDTGFEPQAQPCLNGGKDIVARCGASEFAAGALGARPQCRLLILLLPT
jgi:hypothetical protein